MHMRDAKTMQCAFKSFFSVEVLEPKWYPPIISNYMFREL